MVKCNELNNKICIGVRLRAFLFVLCDVHYSLKFKSYMGFTLITEAKDWSERKKKGALGKETPNSDSVVYGLWLLM